MVDLRLPMIHLKTRVLVDGQPLFHDCEYDVKLTLGEGIRLHVVCVLSLLLPMWITLLGLTL